VFAHQVGLWMKSFQVAANGDRLGEIAAVVEVHERYAARWILGQHLRRAILALGNIDILRRDLESLFRQENSESSGIRSESETIYFHSGCNLKPQRVRRQPSNGERYSALRRSTTRRALNSVGGIVPSSTIRIRGRSSHWRITSASSLTLSSRELNSSSGAQVSATMVKVSIT